jgi:MFS family permease
MNAPLAGHVQTEQRNITHLVYDLAWFGLALAATSRFLSVFAIRVGATPLELGLLAALPNLVLLFSSGLGTWWLRRWGFKDALQAMPIPAFTFRLVFLLPFFTPFLPLQYQPVWLVFASCLPALAQGVAGVNFLMMMRAAVSEMRMPSLTGQRALAMNVCLGIGALLFGVLLEKVVFPLNYQIMFLIAFGFSLISLWHATRVKLIAPEAAAPPPVDRTSTSPWRSPQFRSMAIITGLLHLAYTVLLSIIPLYLVEKLDATEGFMAVFGMLELAAGALAAMLAPRIIERIGTRTVMAWSMVALALAAVIIALAPSLAVTLLAAILTGAAWTAAASVGLMSYFMTYTPSGETSSYSVAFHQAIGLTMFVGPLLGSLLATSGMNLVIILLLGAGVRLIIALAVAPHSAEKPFGFRLPWVRARRAPVTR